MNIPNVRQTKFLMAVFILLIATVVMLVSLVMYYTGGSSASPFVTFDSWWQVGLFLLGLYSTADIVSTHLQQAKQVPPGDQTA